MPGRPHRKTVNCLECRYYYVTWDRHFPRGCRALDFKTRYFPASVVLNASGIRCGFFQKRDRAEKPRSR